MPENDDQTTSEESQDSTPGTSEDQPTSGESQDQPKSRDQTTPEKTRWGARVFLAFISGALIVALMWAGLDFFGSGDNDDPVPTFASVTTTPATQPPEGPATTMAPASTTSSTTTTTEPDIFNVTVPDTEREPYNMEPYTGLGAWLDVFDWTVDNAGDDRVGPGIVDRLAANGVQTLYIQAGKWDSPAPTLEPNLLRLFLDRARAHDMSVVGWYVPGYEDPQADLERLLAITELPVDGIAVDIEATTEDDVAVRNRNAVALADELRILLPDDIIGAIVLEPVLLEDVNPDYWPQYPWEELAPSYDVWLPMNYWTNRSSSGPWDDPHLYTITNVNRVRELIGKPNAPVHVLGGIADQTTRRHLSRFRQAAEDVGAVGGSIYDVRTTEDELWPALEHFQTTRAASSGG